MKAQPKPREAYVAIGDIIVSQNKEKLLSTFVGSCVALCLYDPVGQIAGLAHVMLPHKGSGKQHQRIGSPGKYADRAVRTMVSIMVRRGAILHRIRAKIVGGASIFTHEGGVSLFNVGERNVQAIISHLDQIGIPLVSQDTGMNYGRGVKFSVSSGEVMVSGKNGRRKL